MADRKVAVIGAGLAGMAAALSAQAAGAEVILINMGPGATAFCSGGLDLAGDPCPPDNRPDAVGRDVAHNLARLIVQRPDHPYALLATDADKPEAGALSLIRAGLQLLFPADGRVRLEGSPDQNQPCFTALGTLKFTALFPGSTARPGAEGMDRPLALGIRGLADFSPATWVRVAEDNAGRIGLGMAGRTGWLCLDHDHDRQSPALAAAIARDPEAFVAAVASAAAAHPEASALVLPPVLPAGVRSDLIRRLEEASGRPLYECLSLPPSVPGLRLTEHLEARGRQGGIETVAGRVVGFTAKDGRITGLQVSDPNGTRTVAADAVILASGKFLGGGLEKLRSFRETVFDLPVFLAGAAAGEVFIEKTVDLHVTGPHPLFAAGVKSDRELRPAGRDGTAAFANLFAAGAVLAGHNYLRDGTGAGVALATGVRAGRNAAESVP